ncbi:hypothetical protein [Falsirhodobacter deserti]|uniref:hypothetical protein n=1 Tax=Falsirhodobacter deserti TaxID=1365611 RepID=UPI000FE386B9|nr:hypothetical protein [Falsirhodobacter deserti]
MEHVSQRAFFVLGCVAIIAVLIIAMLVLSSLLPREQDKARVRLLLRLRVMAQVLAVGMILLVAWAARGV